MPCLHQIGKTPQKQEPNKNEGSKTSLHTPPTAAQDNNVFLIIIIGYLLLNSPSIHSLNTITSSIKITKSSSSSSKTKTRTKRRYSSVKNQSRTKAEEINEKEGQKRR